MKNVNRILSMLLLVTIVLLYNCSSKQNSVKPEVAEPTAQQLVQKGEYLVGIMGCNDCHSPKVVGPQGYTLIPELLLSGYQANSTLPKVEVNALKKWYLFNDDMTAAVGPWGVSFAGNLTSDPTGIGNWTEENFKRAIKEGKFKGLEGARTLLPPMPWVNYANISDDDVKAIFAYLQSTKPVRNVVPAPIPPSDLASN